MPAPSVTVLNPPPLTYFDPGILRPAARVKWSGGTGPFDVTHEWDTDNLFGSPIQDINTGAASPDPGTPPSDMGPAGTTWYYRVTVEDTSDGATTTSAVYELEWSDPVAFQRFLYLLTNVGAGWDPIDTPAAGWDPEGHGAADAGDGYAITPQRFLHLLTNVGAGFDPIDTPAAGWDPEGHGAADAGDGYAITFKRFLYLLANADNTVPTPHIWYVYPDFGREGWEFKVVGYGFGDTQATYNGTVLLNTLGASVVDWSLIAETDPDLTIDPQNDTAEPVHQEVRAVVPLGAESGLVYICTDA